MFGLFTLCPFCLRQEIVSHSTDRVKGCILYIRTVVLTDVEGKLISVTIYEKILLTSAR